MVTWDPDQYLRFAGDRARPFVDLVARIGAESPATVVGLGSGAGNLSDVLRARWPHAAILGVDASPEMVEAAASRDDGVEYRIADVTTWRPDRPVDVMVSNALFQWIETQGEVILDLMRHVRPGGWFALQVPNNGAAPSHTLLADLASREPYAAFAGDARRVPPLDPQFYVELFGAAGWVFDVWETTYQHVLRGPDPVWEWVSGTGARPIVQSLPDDLRPQFVQQYRAALREAYPEQTWGTMLPFRRAFAIAQRPI